MHCNIYRGTKLVEENSFFRSWLKAVSYCDVICPFKYGSGEYHAVIIGR